MSELASPLSPILYLMVCAAPPAQQTQEVLPLLQVAGWDVCVIATPQASRWMNTEAKADVMLVMPTTFNTINKWAQGIGDTLVTSILCEALGRGTPPIVTVPCLRKERCEMGVAQGHGFMLATSIKLAG
jgi:phosphopantothenoylcysteine decarboxylase